jgi:hypothetical protein
MRLTYRDVANPGEKASVHALLVKRARCQKAELIAVLADHEGTNPRFQSKLRQLALELAQDAAPERGGMVHSRF